MNEVKLWRYYIPSEGIEGWAEIVITSTGFFAAVSDFGNYAYAWRDAGCNDVRKFFINAHKNWDYFAHKLGGEHSQDYDDVATLKNVKEHLLELRRRKRLTCELARDEWDLLRDCNDLYNSHDFERWYERTVLDDAYELRREKINTHIEIFCRQTMEKLSALIQEQLASE